MKGNSFFALLEDPNTSDTSSTSKRKKKKKTSKKNKTGESEQAQLSQQQNTQQVPSEDEDTTEMEPAQTRKSKRKKKPEKQDEQQQPSQQPPKILNTLFEPIPKHEYEAASPTSPHPNEVPEQGHARPNSSTKGSKREVEAATAEEEEEEDGSVNYRSKHPPGIVTQPVALSIKPPTPQAKKSQRTKGQRVKHKLAAKDPGDHEHSDDDYREEHIMTDPFDAVNRTTASFSSNSSTSSLATPTTPISPSRVPFQSISTVETLVHNLEESATTSSKNTRRLIWKEWALMIREAETTNPHRYIDDNYQLLTFKEVFLKSKALEKVVESVILDPELPSEAELWELFGLCLSGDENVHYQIIHTLKRMGELIKGKKGTLLTLVIKSMAELVSELKIKPDQKKLLVASLRDIDRQVIESIEKLSSKYGNKTLDEKAKISSELVSLWQQKRNLLLSFSKKNGTASPHVLPSVNELEVQLEKLQPNVSLSVQFKKLTEERKKNEAQIRSQLKEADTTLNDDKKRERELNTRKKQLEEELKKVNQELDAISERKMSIAKQKESLHDQLSKMIEIYEQKDEELKGLADMYLEEHQNMGRLKSLLTNAKNMLATTTAQRSDAVELQLQQATAQYLEQVGVLLDYQNQRILDLLKNKISRLCEKLSSLRAKRQKEENHCEDLLEIDKKIRKYYKHYMTATLIAEDILRTAETYNKSIREFEADPQYAEIIRKQIDKPLEILVQSERMLLQFNSNLTWVESEVLARGRAKGCEPNYDTDSDFSNNEALSPRQRLQKLQISNDSIPFPPCAPSTERPERAERIERPPTPASQAAMEQFNSLPKATHKREESATTTSQHPPPFHAFPVPSPSSSTKSEKSDASNGSSNSRRHRNKKKK